MQIFYIEIHFFWPKYETNWSAAESILMNILGGQFDASKMRPFHFCLCAVSFTHNKLKTLNGKGNQRQTQEAFVSELVLEQWPRTKWNFG